MKRNLYTIFYAFVLGVVCALVPTIVGEFTAPYREANARAEEVRNIMHVLDIPIKQGITSRQLVDQFESTVKLRKKGNLQMYISYDTVDTSKVHAIAVQFSGSGVWGLIKGFIALDTDMVTIRRISFYQNEETPGLGGEIGTEWFQNEFIGKKIRDDSGKPGIRIKRSGARGPNEIDGISGATLTCGKVQSVLSSIIEVIDKEVGFGK